MQDILHRLYRVSPPAIQDLMVSAQGYRLASKRYRPTYYRHLNELMRTQWLSREQFSVLQEQTLRSLLKEAVEECPWYKETLAPWHTRLDSFTLADLADLPFVEPLDLRRETQSFINTRRLGTYGGHEGHTSGTSGSPLIWQTDWATSVHNLAFRGRQYRWAGITGKEPSARFSGRALLGRNSSSPFWRYNLAEKQWLFSTYHMTEENLPCYYDKLIRISPAYLDGYPSAIAALAQWITANGLEQQWRPWVVITTAETLTDEIRQAIRHAFGCQVYDYYSSSEGAPYITECAAGGKHVNPESGIVEILRDDGTPAAAGETGNLVVTSFFQRTMPLIRYRIGDMARMSDRPYACPCRRHMPIVERLEGRESDSLHSVEYGRVSSPGLSTALYCLPGRIRMTQIRQIDPASYEVLYVPNGVQLTRTEQHVLLARLRERLGGSARITFRTVPDIPLSANGKRRLVIGMQDSQHQRE